MLKDAAETLFEEMKFVVQMFLGLVLFFVLAVPLFAFLEKFLMNVPALLISLGVAGCVEAEAAERTQKLMERLKSRRP